MQLLVCRQPSLSRGRKTAMTVAAAVPNRELNRKPAPTAMVPVSSRWYVILLSAVLSVSRLVKPAADQDPLLKNPVLNAGVQAVCNAVAKWVKVPAGVDTGSRLRMSGEGEAGLHGGPPGDLYIVIHVRQHKLFVREGDDVVMEQPISFVQAALGTELEVPTLDGKARIKIPEGTQTGTVFRLRGKGIPRLRGFGSGDQRVRVVVEVPKKLSAKQKEILREFAKVSGETVETGEKRFFDKMKDAFSGK